MGRKPKIFNADADAANAPKIGSNELNDEQRYSLTEQHRQKYEALLEKQKAAVKALKDFGKVVKSDLGASGLQDIKDLITLSTPEGEAAVKAEMERKARVLRWMLVPMGTNGELFPSNDPTPITDRAFAEGRRQGLAGETISNPHHPTTEACRSHVAGYDAGQATNAAGFKPLVDAPVDNTPTGSVPRDQWQKDLAEQNDKVAADIKAAAAIGSTRATFEVQ